MIKICSSKQLVSEQSIFREIRDLFLFSKKLPSIRVGDLSVVDNIGFDLRTHQLFWSQFELLNSYSESYCMNTCHVNYGIGIRGVKGINSL